MISARHLFTYFIKITFIVSEYIGIIYLYSQRNIYYTSAVTFLTSTFSPNKCLSNIYSFYKNSLDTLPVKINPSAKKHLQKGFTLIEVLITLILLVTGLLGAVSMQLQAKKSTFDAMQRSMASSLAQNIIERMKGTGHLSVAYYTENSPYDGETLPSTVKCDAMTSSCNSKQMANYHLAQWEQALIGVNVRRDGINIGGLIDAVGCIMQVGHTLNVTISWRGKSHITAANKTGQCGENTPFRRQVLVTSFIG